MGLSGNALRASHFVGFYLQRHGYRVIPVNPRETEILGEASYPSLLDVPVPVDIVNVFRAPDALPAIAREAVAIHAGALWCQFGVINEEGARIAEDGGVTVIMDRCLKVEHARYVGPDALARLQHASGSHRSAPACNDEDESSSGIGATPESQLSGLGARPLSMELPCNHREAATEFVLHDTSQCLVASAGWQAAGFAALVWM